jgi:hypothetical protein
MLRVPLIVLAALRPDRHVHHRSKAKAALAYLYSGCVLFPTFALLVTWALRLRVAWFWKVEMDEEVLGRFAERLPDGRCVPGGTLPLPSDVVPMVPPGLSADHGLRGGRRGDPDAGAGVLHASAPSPPTKDELVKDLSTFRKPRYDDLYAITITLLIQVKGFG